VVVTHITADSVNEVSLFSCLCVFPLFMLLWMKASPFSSSTPLPPPDLIFLSSIHLADGYSLESIHRRDEATAFHCPPPSHYPSSLNLTDTLILCSGSVYRHNRPQRIGLEIIVLLSHFIWNGIGRYSPQSSGCLAFTHTCTQME